MSSEQLNEQDCLTVLRSKLQHERFKLLNYEVESFAVKIGHMSNQYRLKCTILNEISDEITVHSFFLKVKLADKNDPLWQLIYNLPLHEQEIGMYKLINDEINEYIKRKWSPDFYGTFNERIIVLEDLSESGHQAALSPPLHWDLEHCHAVLDTLALLHSASVYLAQKYTTDMQQIKSILKEKYPTLFNTDWYKFVKNKMSKAAYRANLFLINKCLPATTIAHNNLKEVVKKRFMNSLTEARTTSNRYLNVINHGDVGMFNMLFKYRKGEELQIENVCFVDFQSIHYSPPAADVIKFIFANTSVEFQKMHMEALLDYYYNKLTVEVNKLGIELATIFSADEFHAACDEIMIDCKLFCFEINSMLLLPDVQRLVTDSEYLLVDPTPLLQDVFDSEMGSTYLEQITPMVQDLHDTVTKYMKLP